MESELLREYLVVVDEMNLTRAADRLHTTQSTLSKHMAVLEREFDAPLLRRGRRGLDITEAGALLYRRAAAIVDLIESARAEVGRLREGRRVCVTGMLQNADIVSLLARVSRTLRDGSGLTMALLPTPTGSATGAVLAGEADIAINHKAFSEELDPALVRIELYREKMLAFVEPGHRLADRETLSFADLRDEKLVRLSDGAAECGWANIIRLCHNHGFEPRGVPLLIDNVIDCLTYPLDDAVLLLQRGMLPLDTFFGGLRQCIPVSDGDAVFTVCLYCRRDRREELAPFIDEVVREAASMGIAGETRAAGHGRFRARCDILAKEASLNESEAAAMAAFARGRSIDRIAADMGASRIMVGDLLASVYKKVGVRERQALLDCIEAVELPW